MAADSEVFLKTKEIQVGEEAGSATVTIVRTGSTAEAVKIQYGIVDYSATAVEDFVAGLYTVTMPAGATEMTVQVEVVSDKIGEGTEHFTFSLVSAEGAGLGVPRTAWISILDDEAPSPPVVEPPLKSNYVVDQKALVGGLDRPVKFEFSPVDPSRVYVAEKGGTVKVANLQDGTATTLLDLRARVNDYGDRGLLDVALHPDFAKNGFIYVFAVIDPSDAAGLKDEAGPDGSGNRYAQVLRFTASAETGFTTIKQGSEMVLLGGAGRTLKDISGDGVKDFMKPEFADLPSSERHVNQAAPAQKTVNGIKQDFIKVDSMTHAGGSLTFGPDGALYVGIGDGASPNYADPHTYDVQNLDSLSGKILRVDPLTGLGLADNPFAGGVGLDTNKAKVWQSGLRNPFSKAFDAEGRLLISNTGWNLWESILQGEKGANFGWPFYEGADGGVSAPSQFYRQLWEAKAFYAAVERGEVSITAPFRAFSHYDGDPGYQVQAITAGSSVYTGDKYPEALKNDFFFTDYVDGEVFAVDAKDRTQLKFLWQGAPADVPIDFVQGPDGYMYYAKLAYFQPGAGELGRLEISAIEQPQPPPTRCGTEGDDRLVLTAGDEILDGLGGRDWLDMLATGRRGSAVSAQPDGKVGVAHDGQNDAIANVEEIRFADGRLAFDPADPAAKALRLYEAAFDRLPDQSGLNFWINALQDGRPLSLLAEGFLSSPEFAARFGEVAGNGAFVDRLYINVLGRAGEGEGRAFWVGALDGGALGRADVLVAFSESVENRAGTAALLRDGVWDRSEEAMEVARLYDTVFGRRPDVEGLNFWKGALEDGTASLAQMADAFTSGMEFRGRYGALDDRGFAEALYVNALDRPADQAGLDFWARQLGAGVARSEVVLAFSESAEHVALTADAIGGEHPSQFGILFA